MRFKYSRFVNFDINDAYDNSLLDRLSLMSLLLFKNAFIDIFYILLLLSINVYSFIKYNNKNTFENAGSDYKDLITF